MELIKKKMIPWIEQNKREYLQLYSVQTITDRLDLSISHSYADTRSCLLKVS
jgi:hypothetical protein